MYICYRVPLLKFSLVWYLVLQDIEGNVLCLE